MSQSVPCIFSVVNPRIDGRFKTHKHTVVLILFWKIYRFSIHYPGTDDGSSTQCDLALTALNTGTIFESLTRANPEHMVSGFGLPRVPSTLPVRRGPPDGDGVYCCKYNTYNCCAVVVFVAQLLAPDFHHLTTSLPCRHRFFKIDSICHFAASFSWKLVGQDNNIVALNRFLLKIKGPRNCWRGLCSAANIARVDNKVGPRSGRRVYCFVKMLF